MNMRNFMIICCFVAWLMLPQYALAEVPKNLATDKTPVLKSVYANVELHESRAIFDETFSWLTPSGADKTLDRIKNAGFNVYIPCVWMGKGTVWSSKLAPIAPEWIAKYVSGHDPLTYLIRRAHEMGIEVQPWFTVMTRWRDFFPEFYDDGTPEHAFNVHVPEFRKFIVDLMLEVVRNYDVDGINLDVIRSRGLCKSAYCVEDYKNKFGRDLLADLQFNDLTPERLREKTQNWEYLKEWNRLAVSDIVSSFSTQAKAIKPKLLVSVDTIVLIQDFRVQGADSIEWSNNGWIDVIYNMDYYQELNVRLAENGRSRLKQPDSLVVLAGNVELLNTKDAYPRDPQVVTNLLTFARSKWPGGNGVALWTYQFLTDTQIEQIKNGPFKEPAKPFWKKRD
jgi:uncharacterized lipoprotein YddW (UPF0748 family)